MHLGDCTRFFWVCFYATVGEHKTQKLSFYHERTLIGVKPHDLVLKRWKNFLQVLDVLLAWITFAYIVVHINFDVSAEHPFEDVVHETLTGGICIFQAELYDFIVEIVTISHERRFFPISWVLHLWGDQCSVEGKNLSDRLCSDQCSQCAFSTCRLTFLPWPHWPTRWCSVLSW